MQALEQILNNLETPPADWLNGQAPGGKVKQQVENCTTYADAVKVWRKALRWTDGLNRGLVTMLASITSTRSVGEQLWIKLIGPASCGKSTLCEAVSMNTEFVLAKSTIRGFHSGWREDNGKDYSLISRVNGKTLVTKDGDTLLQSPNLPQILSEGRDLYDSVSRSHYRNDAGKDYTGIRMTWILAGTSSLRSIDSSELGERFVDCVIMDRIDSELEDDILWRIANRVNRSMGMEISKTEGQEAETYEPELMHAMRLTGGYVGYLGNNSSRLLKNVVLEEKPLYKLTRWAKFVAYMRARPSRHQKEQHERELAGRLTSQLTRLAKCTATVLNDDHVNEQCMDLVHSVAMDTARGHTLELLRGIANSKRGSLTMHAIELLVNAPPTEIRRLVRFLRSIGVLEANSTRTSSGTRTHRNEYVLTAELAELWHQLQGGA